MGIDKEPEGLEKLVAKYVDSGNVAEAIEVAQQVNFDLMKNEFPRGVPPKIMFGASIVALDWVAQFLTSIMLELAAELKGWDNVKLSEQETMALYSIRLLREDALNHTLATTIAMKDAATPDEETPDE